MSAIGLFLLASTLGAPPEGDAPSVEQVRETVRRSVPYIEEKGVWWIEEKNCVSCHRVGTMLWSLSAARRRGIAVSDRLDEWIDWAIEKSLSTNDKGKIVGSGNKEGVAQLLLALNFGTGESDRTEAYRKLAAVVAGDLQENGTWKPGGQLPSQKRPKQETTDVTTMWLALALRAGLSESGSKRSGGEQRSEAENEHRAEIDKAVQHVAVGQPGKSTEWYAARLLLAQSLNDEKTAEAMAAKLRELQQADGGWGWIVGEKSDALGTGLALYALLQTGAGRDDQSLISAQRFLIETQREDGSWAVNGTKANKRNQIAETAVFWGTTWATLALAESLPD